MGELGEDPPASIVDSVGELGQPGDHGVVVDPGLVGQGLAARVDEGMPEK